MIEIDNNRCIHCKACVSICEFKHIFMCEEGVKTNASSECCDCGHCLAVCPVSAISMPEYDMSQVAEYDKDTFYVAPDHFMNLIKFRRSTRRFKNQDVDKEEIEKLLEAGRYCPTSCNCQDVEYVVVHEKREEIIRKLWKGLAAFAKNNGDDSLLERYEQYVASNGENDTLTYGCSHILFILSGRQLNGGIAACAIELMAASMGLGALYCGYGERAVAYLPELQEWLGLTPQRQLTAILCIGYPDITWKRTVPRKDIRALWY